MSVLYIEGRRNGYDPDQCGETMTVSEMIEFLSQFDGDLPIYLNNDSGYTFGNIDEYSFSECEHDDSERLHVRQHRRVQLQRVRAR